MSTESNTEQEHLRAGLIGSQKEHLRKRAIDPKWAEDWGWHWSGNDEFDTYGRIGIPIYDTKGREVGLRRYRHGATPKVLATTKGVRLFGMHKLGKGDEWIVVVGGEMDLGAARSAGLISVCATAGEGSIPKRDLELLSERRVAIALDCDATGRAASIKWAKTLEGIAAEVRVVDLGGPSKYDVNDWFAGYSRDGMKLASRTADELLELIEASPVGVPASTTRRRRSTEAFLKEALGWVHDGKKAVNVAGFDLAGQLRDEGYTPDEARPVLHEFREACEGVGSKPFLESDADGAVERAYKHEPRQPRGGSGTGINIIRGTSDFDIETIRRKDAGMADLLWEGTERGNLLTERSKAGSILFAEFVGNRWMQGTEAFVDQLTGAIDQFVTPAIRDLYAELDSIDPEEKDAATAIKARIRQLDWYVDRAHTDSGATSAMRYFAKMRRARLGGKLDAHPNLVNFANGTMDIESRDLDKLRAHDRADFITKVIPHAYDPKADQTAWRKHMAEVVPDETERAFLQRWWGVALTGLPVKLVVLLFSEHPHSGKTTTTEIVKRTSGDYAALLPKEALMSRGDRANQAMATMLGVRFATTAEFDKDNLLVESNLKLIASDEFMQIRKLYGEFQEFRPEFKTTITTNNIPELSADEAVWDRIAPVAFPNSFPHKDGLQDRLIREEAEGILAWRVDGLRDYLEKRDLALPESVRALRDRQRADHDTVWQWASEQLVIAPSDFETKDMVRDRFNTWYDHQRLDNRKRPPLTGPTSLGARFKAWLEHGNPGAKHEGGRNGEKWLGVRFR